ncbi:MAG: hypothetical protein ACK5MT_19295 [Actinomycetales bacterium]
MSQFVELAAKVQEQQIAAVKQGQEAFLKYIETIAANAPETPDVEVPEQVQEALKPAYDFFGTPEEVQSFLAEATKTWTRLGQDFQNAVVEQFTVTKS